MRNQDVSLHHPDGEAVRQAGGRVLAIPHNSNLKSGLVSTKRSNRARVSAYCQTKGDSEATPRLFPTDEFANFERWDKANLPSLIATIKWSGYFEHFC
jgi:hypothetical protein